MKYSKNNYRGTRLKDELIDSDDAFPHIGTSGEELSSSFESENGISDSEDFLLEKHNLKDLEHGSSLRNPADSLLTHPRYKGKKANVIELNLPEIHSDASFSHEDSEEHFESNHDDDDDDDDDQASGDVFKRFKSMQSSASEKNVCKPDLLLKRKDDLVKANCLRDQLAFIDDLFTLRILLQKIFVQMHSANLTAAVPMLLQMIPIALEINEKGVGGRIEKKRTFLSIEDLWEYMKQISTLKEPDLLALYDSWWSKSHISFQRPGRNSSNKNLQVLNQGFSGSVTYSLKSYKPSKDPLLFIADSKFYQQLLKDIIDAKLSSSKNANAAKRSIGRLDQERKPVHKASKGRLLSYETHSKLENFMAPRPFHSEWTEEKMSQLFNSLPF
ncbi:hypothetical protein DI09_153p30 [Mitosporidium daphniae]|uniref:Apoptosis-antagonizing transcription factor C-terminal domain-containing protein n=1 Tax=Mitosporidium daphniae TaxID=1485682 RepID=A0A098VUE9_9MICR|nr:uncharacterized protein DI09_153p30 [Mitosporidium daphniae]KGG52602.1 hypothetical protein DI09_153p30 [Mitosporidium daphniae]|eukprot:XP_013239038.1 uncharacterized protein DI09_153p30 [Mitosporidium daphniae]